MTNVILFIIGNGFDLSLGLKTSYQDFLKSGEFKIIEGSSLCQYLKKKQKLQNWVDIEKELSNYCMDMYKIKTPYDGLNLHERFKEEYYELKEQLKIYLTRQEETIKSISLNNYTIHLLKDLVRSQSSSIEVITFNYTDILDRISEYSRIGIKTNVHHVHGSLKTDIVFGVEDKVELQNEEGFLYKSFSPYKEIRPIKQLLNLFANVIFFGYSLGDTDRQYFEDYFNNLAKGRGEEHNFAFYYYNNANSIKWQLQRFTGYDLSNLEMNNCVEYINCSQDYQGLPNFIQNGTNI